MKKNKCKQNHSKARYVFLYSLNLTSDHKIKIRSLVFLKEKSLPIVGFVYVLLAVLRDIPKLLRVKSGSSTVPVVAVHAS